MTGNCMNCEHCDTEWKNDIYQVRCTKFSTFVCLYSSCDYYTPTADVVPKSEEGAECPTCHGTGRIGTTNWLTKNISKKQLAEEKAQAIAEHEQYIKTEYAREIFEEIEKIFDGKKYVPYPLDALAELKKKYAESENG